MRPFPTMISDFATTHLRSQITRLNMILEHLEGDKAHGGYMTSSLKDIEANIRRLRKVCETN